MDGLYGKISVEQLTDFKRWLHSKIHWLLVYKESEEFDVNLNDYFLEVMRLIGSAGEVLKQDSISLQILTLLNRAKTEAESEDYSHERYRHYILEAHNLVDRLGVA